VLPLNAAVGEDGTGYGITRDGPGGSLDLWPAPGGDAAGLAGDAVELARESRTNRLGHLLAPMGVRYVALPPRSGADGGADAQPTPALERGLADQLDLSRLESDGGLVLYENDVWAATPSVLVDGELAQLHPAAGDPTLAALTSDVSAAEPVRGDRAAPAGAVLQAESYSSEWAASDDGELRHVEAFGWANGYEHTARGEIDFTFGGQWRRHVVALAQVALWVALGWFWLRGTDRLVGRRERRAAGAADQAVAEGGAT
jgi:hypothetical protein